MANKLRTVLLYGLIPAALIALSFYVGFLPSALLGFYIYRSGGGGTRARTVVANRRTRQSGNLCVAHAAV